MRRLLTNFLRQLQIHNYDDEVIPTTSQVSVKDAINAFELGMQLAEENSASYNFYF